MSAEADIVERLVQDHQQLRKMTEAAHFAGKETGVRVRDTSALLEDLDDAVAEITKLRAERDAAVLAERERCASICMDLRHPDKSRESDDWIDGTEACASAILATDGGTKA